MRGLGSLAGFSLLMTRFLVQFAKVLLLTSGNLPAHCAASPLAAGEMVQTAGGMLIRSLQPPSHRKTRCVLFSSFPTRRVTLALSQGAVLTNPRCSGPGAQVRRLDDEELRRLRCAARSPLHCGKAQGCGPRLLFCQPPNTAISSQTRIPESS